VRARARARCDGLETVVVSITQKGFPVTQMSSSTSVLVLLLYCKNTLLIYVQAMYYLLLHYYYYYFIVTIIIRKEAQIFSHNLICYQFYCLLRVSAFGKAAIKQNLASK